MKADLKLLELAIGLTFLFKIPIQAEDQVPDRNQYNDYNFAFASGNVAKVREFINRFPSLVTNNTWGSQPLCALQSISGVILISSHRVAPM